MNTTTAAIAALVTAAVALPATAGVGPMPFSDDLTDGMFDPNFNYDFSSDFTGGGDFNELINGSGLCLCSDEVSITFPGVSDPVGLAQVDVADFTGVGATNVTFIGTMGSVNFSNTLVSASESYQVTLADGIGAITEIRITAFESFLTNVALRTIPTPGALAIFGAAGLAAVRRRR